MTAAEDTWSIEDSVITQFQPVLMGAAPRVLLVDDDPLALQRFADLIGAAGYDVTTATNGADALITLATQFAPIVVLDREMPGIDGLELCRRIRGAQWPGYVYLMLVTAHDSEEEILAGLDAGADDYLSKRLPGAHVIARLATARRILQLEHSLKQVIEERRRLAMTDALTGAHNRRYFMNHMRRELKRTRRFGGEVTLIVCDIDHFKHINDRYGHAAGDTVLCEAVRRMQQSLPREYDWCARLGGEEFAIVLPQTPLAGGEVVAQRIRRAMTAAPVVTKHGPVEFTVSIGVSGLACFADRSAVSADHLLARADDCLYRSKNGGRDRVTVDTPLP